MPITTRVRSIILLALLAGVSNATAIRTPPAEFRATYSLGPAGRIVIQNLYGDVEISAWDRDEVFIQAIKHSPNPDRLNDAHIVVDSSCGFVSIHTEYTGADTGRPASVNYHIKVPRGANLENIRLINGGLFLTGLSGPIKATSVNGNIHAEKLAGQVELSTINGHLDADFQQIGRSRTISLSSVNGPIHLGLPTGAGANILAQNRSGGIESEFARSWRTSQGHRLEAAVHGGGAQIHLHNVNGGISIHSNWPTRALPPIS